MPAPIADCFLKACRAELQALKPGNVHIHAPGHGMEVRHFEDAARAAAPVIALPGLGVGERVRRAVEASMAAAGCNTNLGILLLAAPLISAALSPPPEAGLEALTQRLRPVLAELTIADAQAAFAGIAAANPGGLGAAAEADVRAPAQIDLRAAMALAAERDLIARQYVRDFQDVREIGVAELEADPTAPRGVENAYLALLAAHPDSHIARKFGDAVAHGVQHEARSLRTPLSSATPDERHALLSGFDASLKARGINPGTTADLTVASVLMALLAG